VLVEHVDPTPHFVAHGLVPQLAVQHEQAPAAEEGFIYGLPIVMNCAG
jgi:hypothetical protein